MAIQQGVGCRIGIEKEEQHFEGKKEGRGCGKKKDTIPFSLRKNLQGGGKYTPKVNSGEPGEVVSRKCGSEPAGKGREGVFS